MALKPIPINIPQWDEEKNQLSARWVGYYLDIQANLTSTPAPNDASYIVKTSSSSLSNEQAIGSLSSGFMKVTTGTGTISSTGNTTIRTADIEDLNVTTGKLAADAVTNAKIADAQVSLEHLDSGIAPSHFSAYAGTFTTVGGDAVESISVSGVTTADKAFVVVSTRGGTPRYVQHAVTASNAITVTLDGDPSTDHVLTYIVFRTAS